MNLDVEFTSIGCNRVVDVLDFGDADLIAYGAHHFVVIYDVAVSLGLNLCSLPLSRAAKYMETWREPLWLLAQEARIVATLVGHTGRVDCVKWLPSSGKGVSAVTTLPDAIHLPL